MPKSGKYMKRLLLSTIAGAAMLCLALNLHASTPPMQNAISDGADASLVRLDGGEVAMLRQSYAILAVADHDYKGHRIAAMKAINAACKLLGTDLSGEGRGHEKQAISDAQLQQVLATIQQVRNSLASAGTQPRVVKHLDAAINQLNIALTVH
jgi:hypothetical protein